MKTCVIFISSLMLLIVISSTTKAPMEVMSNADPATRQKRKVVIVHEEINKALLFREKMSTIRLPTLRELCTHRRCNAKCLLRRYKNGGFCDATGCRCL